MIKNNSKTVYLNISTIKFPITAIVSILHRISGMFLFIAIGPMLWILRLSLNSESSFYKINSFFLANNSICKFLSWITIIIFSYHVIFGIRQILMDFGYLKQTLFIGKISASFVFIIIIVVSIFFGIHIWDLLN